MFSRMKFTSRFVVCLIVFCFSTHRAWSDESPAPNATQSFQQGLKEYKAGQFDKAEQNFQSALQQSGSNSTVNKDAILTNLALAQYQQQKAGLAISNLRKALNLNPENQVAKEALDFAWSKLAVKEIPHQIDSFEVIRASVLSSISNFFCELFFAICVFAFAWQILNLMGARKRAKAEQSLAPSPELRHLFMLIAFLISSFLFVAKKYDSSLTRGTIIANKVSANVSPGEDQVALFDLYEGFEVQVIAQKDNFFQVTYPGGGTGWIESKNLSLDSEYRSN